MADSTQHNATRAITVPFHGADLYVVEHNGQPYTPMKPIVEGMGLDWKSQHRKLAANESRWGMVEMTIPSAGGAQSASSLPVRKVAAWLATIEPGKVKNPDVRARVVTYQNECDDVLWQYWNDGIAINPRTAYSVLLDQTISDKQAETLRLLLTENVKKLPKEKQAGAMVKGWSKLKAHFKTDYRHIPAGEFHEAVNILARHVAEWDLVEDANKTPRPSYDDAVRTQAAFDAASQAAARVQSAVFNSVMAGNHEWKYNRWVLAFIDDSEKAAPAYVRQLEHGSFTTTWPRLVRDVANGECMCTTAELLDMAYACMQRLAQRGATAKLAA